jgi:hypothetical protein
VTDKKKRMNRFPKSSHFSFRCEILVQLVLSSTTIPTTLLFERSCLPVDNTSPYWTASKKVAFVRSLDRRDRLFFSSIAKQSKKNVAPGYDVVGWSALLSREASTIHFAQFPTSEASGGAVTLKLVWVHAELL